MINEDKLYETVGRLIRSARDEKNLNQDDVSSQLGLTRTSVSNIERGKQHIQLHTLYHVAELLNVPVVDLLPDLELVIQRDVLPSPEQAALVQQLLNVSKPKEL